MPELRITQGVLANHLGVSRLSVSELLHEKRGLSAEMAVRLSKVIGGTAESWLRMQEALNPAHRSSARLFSLFKCSGQVFFSADCCKILPQAIQASQRIRLSQVLPQIANK